MGFQKFQKDVIQCHKIHELTLLSITSILVFPVLKISLTENYIKLCLPGQEVSNCKCEHVISVQLHCYHPQKKDQEIVKRFFWYALLKF